jgi:hypothetical protein
MVVVPYIPPIPDPEESKILELDNEMTNILQDKTINLDDKLQRYNMVLIKFLSIYKPNTVLTSVYSQMHEANESQPTNELKREVKEEEVDHKPEFKIQLPSVVMPLLSTPIDKLTSIKKPIPHVTPYTVPKKKNRARLEQNESFIEHQIKPSVNFKFDNLKQENTDSSFHNTLNESINDQTIDDDEFMDLETIPNPPPLNPHIFNNLNNSGYNRLLRKLKITRKNASIRSIAAKVKSNIRDYENNRRLINLNNNNLLWQNLNSMYGDYPSDKKRGLTQMDDSYVGPLTRALKKIKE